MTTSRRSVLRGSILAGAAAVTGAAAVAETAPKRGAFPACPGCTRAARPHLPPTVPPPSI